MTILYLIAALVMCGSSVYCFCKANYCACTQAGECDNPVNHYWLSAIVFSLVSLLLNCWALHSEQGTLLWLLMMSSCLAGAQLSARFQKTKKSCAKSKQSDALLRDVIN